MSSPRVDIDLDKIEHNTRALVGKLAVRGVSVAGITKAVLGCPEIGAAMIRGGARCLGDSRIPNLARLGELEPVPSRWLIRSPLLSQVDQVVAKAEVSLNTEAVVLRALNQAAAQRRTRHGVVLMVELGDLREGISVADVGAAVRLVNELPWLRLEGLGANLACQNGVVPDETNMGVLNRLTERIEIRQRTSIAVVSAGNSANLEWAFTTDDLGRANELRIGEAILLGTEPLRRTAIPGLYTDAFMLTAEVIEVAEKPAQPWGSRAHSAFGVPLARASTGTVRQAIVALGHQDVDLGGLLLPAGISVLGMSSDHLVLDIGDHTVAVGDEITFTLAYSALVRAMTSPFVSKVERERSIAPAMLLRPPTTPRAVA